jgi:autoinducer 2 (AI-2) kinase
VFEGAAIDEECGASVYETTGHLPSFLSAPARLAWFENHRHEDYNCIAHVLTIADWLTWRLTGILASEATLACDAGLLNINSRKWIRPVYGETGIDINSTFVASSGTVVGGISKKAADEICLNSGTPVATAGADTQCGLLGLGVINEPQVGVISGWSTAVQMVTNRPVLSPERKTWAGYFLDDARWVLESSPGDTGSSYQWLHNLLFGDSADNFSHMNSIAAKVPVGSEGVKALFGSPRMDMSRPGMKTGGFVMPVPLTFSSVGRGHLVRAYLESIAYSIRANIEQIEELSGKKASRIAVGGGMTRTPVFNEILSNVLGREIEVSANPQVSALGAYLCARTAIGDFASLEEAAQSIACNLETVEPDIMDSAEYEDHYEQWLEMSDKLQEISL